jgi:hypothetical protein
VVGELLTLLTAHLALTALPAAAAVLLVARLGVKSVPVLLAIGLAATGVLAMLAFWAYYADRVIGEACSFFVLFGSIPLAAWALYGGRIDTGLLQQLATPLTLWALGSAFLVFLGFIHGGTEAPVTMAASRFYGPLPSDNDIPRYFAEWFYLHGHSGHPLFPPNWLASDRPPLQTGYVLLQRPFVWDARGVNYQVLGVVLQQLWIVGLWALLLAARVGRLTRALTIATVLVSDVAIVNGFFVWPKMLPAAMLLAAAALIVTPLWSTMRRQALSAVLVAALAALAMLGHGSSVFGIIPLALVAALRGFPSWRWIGVGLLTGIVLMAPWSAYQKYGEPPGNRLLKYMLAGVVEVDKRGTSEAIVDAYDEVGIGGAIHNKAENFVTMAGGGPMVDHIKAAIEDIESGNANSFLTEIRTNLFYCLLPSLGLLLIAPGLMLADRRRSCLNPAEWSFSLTCFTILIFGAIVWGLLMFGNEASRTVLHQGSFVLPVLGLCGAVCGLRAVLPRFALYFVVLSALLMLAIYVPVLNPLPGTSFSILSAFIAAASLVGFGAVALRSGDTPLKTYRRM